MLALIKMTRNIIFAQDNFYHIYNRGTEKRPIFVSDRDRERFLVLLYLCNGTNPVDLKLQGSTLEEARDADRGSSLINLCAYCLMPNHFHLLIHEHCIGGISHFMQKLTTGYTMYFNKWHERDGSLFQGKYKASHADTNSYLSYLIAYIHLNPIKLIEPNWKEAGITDPNRARRHLEKYRYSSYPDYCGQSRIEGTLICPDILPKYFNSPRDFESSTTSWLNYKKLQGSTL